MSNVIPLRPRDRVSAISDEFRDLQGKSNIPAPTMASALTALKKLGVNCSYDEFKDIRYVGGESLGSEIGQLSDDTCLLIRKICRDRFGFDPGKDNTWDAVNLMCRMNTFNSVVDYLDGLRWDGVKRIDTFLIDYMHAEDTPLNRHIGKMVLVASVRRARHPGCKYDYMTVAGEFAGQREIQRHRCTLWR
jgi:Virulence-associated protein E